MKRIKRAAVLVSLFALACGPNQVNVTYDETNNLAVLVDGAGRVLSEPAGIDCPGACDADFAASTTVELIPLAEAGAELIGFSGDCSGSACIVSMDQDRLVSTAFVKPDVQSLTVELVGPETGQVVSQPAGIDCPGTCTAEFKTGQTVELFNFPQGSFTEFGGYYRDCEGESCTLIMDGERSVMAAFARPFRAWYVHGLGLANNDAPRAVVVNAIGDTYIASDVFVESDLGGGTLTSAGSVDIGLAKFDIEGNYLWSFAIGSTGADHVDDFSLDPEDNLVVVGKFAGTVDFGGQSLTASGSADAFIAKYDPEGQLVFLKKLSATVYEDIFGVDVDRNGNVYLAGRFNGTITFEAARTSTTDGGGDGFLAKMRPDGTFEWSRRIGDSGVTERARDVAVGGDNDEVAVAGTYQGTIDLGGGLRSSLGSVDGYVAKYDSSGAYLWDRVFGSAASDVVGDVDVGPSGDVAFSGTSSAGLNLGNGNISYLNQGGSDCFAVRLRGNNGSTLWSHWIGGTGSDSAQDVSFDRAGNVYVTGSFQNQVNAFGGMISSAGSSDIFVAKLNADGSPRWTRLLGSSNLDGNTSLAADPNGHVSVLGFVSADASFGLFDVDNVGGWDLVLLRIGR